MRLKEGLSTIKKFSLAFKQLEPMERTAFRLRVGKYVIYNEERTLEEVGKQMGITRERVRQLVKTAEEKLNKFLEEFKDFEEVERPR